MNAVCQASELGAARMHRFEVRVREGARDPRAESLRREAAEIGMPLTGVRVARVYLVYAALDEAARHMVAREGLSNPAQEDVTLGAEPVAPDAVCIEVHPLPGVMDPPAQTVEEAVRELTGAMRVRAATGWRYDLTGADEASARRLADRLLANPVVQAVRTAPYTPEKFPHGESRRSPLRSVAIRELDDDALARLSRAGHLFLSLDEMRAIRAHFRELGREPTDIELETLAQTWSEHCVHKTLKSDILYRGPAGDVIDWSNRPGHEVRPDGSVKISNLLRSTVAAATHELIAEGLDWTLSVFVDNAGIIAFDDKNAVCVKVETHNHPSALEPYGGAATGVGGCIRDIIGTGLAAKPIANTDVFCVGFPDHFDDSNLPAGCLHPRRILRQVVAGVRDYGNRMGVPTVSGAVFFDDHYVGNPLVYCGCVGVMGRDKIEGDAQPGDVIVALGGRTGRDGIHGATFSSAELTDTHADEFSHAVQIGNPIEEKKVLDAILRARDCAGGPLFRAITDCGAGGFSSAVGEMGEKIGAEVFLERAPLKYEGLTYSEIWISEAQERMVLAVPPDRLDALRAICDEESVEMAELGAFGAPNQELLLHYHGEEVGRLSMKFMHEGAPRNLRRAKWTPSIGAKEKGAAATPPANHQGGAITGALLALLAHPNIASKRWIVRQYDHEVQGATVVKPLVGPAGDGPGDATVILPVPGSSRGLAISQGLAVATGDPARGGDPYLMALAAVDECVRNLVCVGADPSRIAILDNFCWPSCEKPENLGSLVRAAEGCYDAAKAYKTPFISGKDSLNNQFTTEDGATIEIPPTLLITGVGIVPDARRCVTMDLKGGPDGAESVLVLVGPPAGARVEPALGARVARAVHEVLRDGRVRAAHDASEGGVLTAIAEMVIAAGTVGAEVSLDAMRACALNSVDDSAALLGEGPARYVLEVTDAAVAEQLVSLGAPSAVIGRVSADIAGVVVEGADEPIAVALESLRGAFFGALDW